MSSSSGILWIVATPLGNPGDLSPRARQVLTEADGVLAEDTRRAGLLFSRWGLAAPHFTSFHEHNESERHDGVLALLRQGRNLALISDAGTPLLSDPGFRLVRACREEGIRVSPVPGPFAPATALCACGLAPQPFVFLGFAPRKKGERESFFAPFAALAASLVFFERRDRLPATLAVAGKVLGQREICIARELTKTHEEFIFLNLDEAAELSQDLLGEITVVIGPPLAGARTSEAELERIAAEERKAGGGARETARRVKERVRGWSGKEIYRHMQAASTGEKA